ncbi:MAG: tol-pal system protein YbgF [Nitrospirae bacterium]|nr:MAG: tol-pal system protein YbgF [Nitrospirota bacterium]
MNTRLTGPGGGLLAIGMAMLLAACATTEDLQTASRQSLAKTEEVRAALQGKIEEINQLQGQAREQQAKLEGLLKQYQSELSIAQQRGAELETKVQEIKGQDLSVVQGQMETIRRDVDGLQSGLDDQKAQGFALGAKVSGVDKRVEEAGKTVGQMAETVKVIGTKLSAQVEQQGQSLAKLEESAKQADGQSRDLAAKVAQFQTALAEFGKVLHSLNDRATEMDRRVAELAGKTEGKAGAQAIPEGDRAAKLEALRKQIEADGQAMKALAVQAEQQAARLAVLEKTLATAQAAQNEPPGGRGEQKRALEEPGGKAAVRADVPPDSPEQPAQRTAIPAEPSRPAGAVSRPAPDSALPAKDAYDRAQGQYGKGQYDLALTSFRLFLIQYPDSSLVPNAHFWMAECYFRTRDYGRGIEEYEQVVKNYPKSEKASRALYRKAMAFLELNDSDAAKATLRQLIADYPKSEDSKQARTKLASLK